MRNIENHILGDLISAAQLDSGIALEAIRLLVVAVVGEADKAHLKTQVLHERMMRIAEAHHKHVDKHGGTSGDCNECSWTWPCPTYTWATTDREPLACWNPRDEE